MNATAATYPKGVEDAAQEILRCLHESLREPAFVSSLILLVSGNRAGAEHRLERWFASEMFAEDGCP